MGYASAHTRLSTVPSAGQRHDPLVEGSGFLTDPAIPAYQWVQTVCTLKKPWLITVDHHIPSSNGDKLGPNPAFPNPNVDPGCNLLSFSKHALNCVVHHYYRTGNG